MKTNKTRTQLSKIIKEQQNKINDLEYIIRKRDSSIHQLSVKIDTMKAEAGRELAKLLKLKYTLGKYNPNNPNLTLTCQLQLCNEMIEYGNPKMIQEQLGMFIAHSLTNEWMKRQYDFNKKRIENNIPTHDIR